MKTREKCLVKLFKTERETDRQADIGPDLLIAETDEEKALIELGNENKRKRLV